MLRTVITVFVHLFYYNLLNESRDGNVQQMNIKVGHAHTLGGTKEC